MDTRKLEALLTAVELGSFTAAATRKAESVFPVIFHSYAAFSGSY